MRVNRILLVAVILGSMFAAPYFHSDYNDVINMASDRIGA